MTSHICIFGDDWALRSYCATCAPLDYAYSRATRVHYALHHSSCQTCASNMNNFPVSAIHGWSAREIAQYTEACQASKQR